MATRIADCGGKGHKKAVLLIGKAPAVEEDRQGASFVGQTGMYTNQLYVVGSSLNDYADVYLVNAVRCRLPNAKMAVPLKSIKACRKHWEADLILLDQVYDEVVVLCTGSEAISAVYGHGVSLSKIKQGEVVELGGRPRKVFATYLAAILLPGNDPSKATAVQDHLALLHEYLRDGNNTVNFTITEADLEYSTRLPEGYEGVVSLDIETYGKMSNAPNQRFFHPTKSTRLDNVRDSELCCTVAMCWRDASGALTHRMYDLGNDVHARDFLEDARRIKRLLGQNTQFDVMYLRAAYPELREAWEPFSPSAPELLDLMVFNFWDSDQRPERSIKNLSPLLSTATYDDDELVDEKGEYRKYTSSSDPHLHTYNVKDAVVTLLNYEILSSRYRSKYGESTLKGTPASVKWFSDLLWLGIHMSESGILYDVPKLEVLCRTVESRLERVLRSGERLLGCLPVGKGSKSYLDDLATRCIDTLGLRGDKRVVLTDVKKEVSAGAANLNLFLGECRGRSKLRRELQCVQRAKSLRDVLSRYYHAMLQRGKKPPKKPGKKWFRWLAQGLIDGYAYPNWRIIPSVDDSGQEGGTQQGRITAQNPAVQTVPPPVEHCEKSRFPGGAIIRVDMRQVELRVPVMYSHEKEVAERFAAGISPYERAATLICGFDVRKKTHPLEYLLGKTAILAIQFRAMAKKLAETARRDLGIDKPLSFWEDVIRQQYADRAGLIAQQDAWIKAAGDHGFIEAPVCGISRTFLGTEQTLKETYIPTIVNFPIQTLAAILTLDAQIEAMRVMKGMGLKVVQIKNTYDEGVYDVPADEVEVVKHLLPMIYMKPPLYHWLVEERGMYPVPLDVSVEVVYNS
jgi:uracil-DNA glycosylase family 4